MEESKTLSVTITRFGHNVETGEYDATISVSIDGSLVNCTWSGNEEEALPLESDYLASDVLGRIQSALERDGYENNAGSLEEWYYQKLDSITIEI